MKRHERQKPQLALWYERKAFTTGGGKATSHAKTKRIISTKQPIHLVMKSSLATGSRSLLKPQNRQAAERILSRTASKFGVRVYRQVLMGNHIHMVIRVHNRQEFAKFLKSAPSLIAQHILRLKRGQKSELLAVLKRGFWDARPFTRVVSSWGQDYRRVLKYLARNLIQAYGFDGLDLWAGTEPMQWAG